MSMGKEYTQGKGFTGEEGLMIALRFPDQASHQRMRLMSIVVIGPAAGRRHECRSMNAAREQYPGLWF